MPVRTVGLTALFVGLFLVVQPAHGQYFGRNKVQYDKFDFQTFKTSNFEFYLYPEEELAVSDASRMAERWYKRHSQTFLREFADPKPIIFYANDADFQQTNAIGSTIGQGTGGVTESLKERVIMPLTGSYRETDHVLGHELVHSFQYDIALSRTDSTRFAINLLPLWLVEGMAEYLSVGREDPHTAMWMRDAALRDDLPTIDQLSRDFRYFPYRYGQAILAYVGGKYGDQAVANLFKLGGRTGLDSAFVYTLGIKADSLSKEWIAAVKDTYLPLAEGRTPADSAGRKVLAEDIDAGEINVSPVVSPDGNYVAFLSERDLFAFNLFIADATTGKVVKRLKETTSGSHFDAIRFINSAGSWSPDGRRFAFITFVQGDNEISILDWNSSSIERRISVEGVTAMSNPAWSPDGRSIAFSGMDGGISDLYVLNMQTGDVRQLTNDRYSDLQPTWSPDGATLAFVTDRGPQGTEFETLSYGKERIGLLDLASGSIRTVRPFDGRHTNPQFSPDGRSLFFISDHDGFKDVYRYVLSDRSLYRVTNLQTGVSGITATSPAMSVSAQNGRMMFSVFGDNKYTVFSLEAEETQGVPYARPDPSEPATAGILPPIRDRTAGLVGGYLSDPLTGLPPLSEVNLRGYGAKLQLDFVAPPQIGVSAGGPWGSGVVGGIGMYFSDMLGNHNMTVVAQANGSFKDVGAQVAYMNRGHRINYGGIVGHVPVLYSYYSPIDYYSFDQVKQRIFIEQLQGIASYPFTKSRRIEASLGVTRYAVDVEVDRYLLTEFGYTRERIQRDDLEPDPEYFASGGVALVNDYSFFGFTSPVRGGRSRFEIMPFVGTTTYARVLADARHYFSLGDFTLAIRAMHEGKYGLSESEAADSWLYLHEYLGYSNSRSFVRGYSFNSFDNISECTLTEQNECAEIKRLIGTRMALASAEFRIPVFGTEQFGLINFPYLPMELAFFADAGAAWSAEDPLVLDDIGKAKTVDRVPVFSTGVSGRFNLFGYMVLEIFYAKPYQRPGKGGHFGLQLVPGW